jgi:hypothetical protein
VLVDAVDLTTIHKAKGLEWDAVFVPSLTTSRFPAELPLPLPSVKQFRNGDADEPVTVTLSELAAYRACGFSYRLRTVLGFQPFLAPELGYGKAVHLHPAGGQRDPGRHRRVPRCRQHRHGHLPRRAIQHHGGDDHTADRYRRGLRHRRSR